MKLPKISSPDSQKPQTPWDKILTTTPIVLTVVATLLAGLSTSEMTAAQYFGSLAARHQSKASDQWSFFQFKRTRSLIDDNTVETLQNSGLTPSFTPRTLQTLTALFPVDKDHDPLNLTIGNILARSDLMELFTKNQIPPLKNPSSIDPKIQEVIDAILANKSDIDLDKMAATIPTPMIEQAIARAYADAKASEQATEPVTRLIIDRLYKAVQDINASDTDLPADSQSKLSALVRSFKIARLQYRAHRYNFEAGYNAAVAQLLEVQKHKSSFESEHHKLRSRRFFYGMLAAQIGVIAATMAVAVRQKSLIWSLATVAGMGAAIFGAYVYVYV